MRTPPAKANDHGRPSHKAIQTVTARYAVDTAPAPILPSRRWPRVRRLASWVSGALVVLTAVGTAAVVVHHNGTLDVPTVDNFHATNHPEVTARWHSLVANAGTARRSDHEWLLRASTSDGNSKVAVGFRSSGRWCWTSGCPSAVTTSSPSPRSPS
jgi:hypothetical protein